MHFLRGDFRAFAFVLYQLCFFHIAVHWSFCFTLFTKKNKNVTPYHLYFSFSLFFRLFTIFIFRFERKSYRKITYEFVCHRFVFTAKCSVCYVLLKNEGKFITLSRNSLLRRKPLNKNTNDKFPSTAKTANEIKKKKSAQNTKFLHTLLISVYIFQRIRLLFDLIFFSTLYEFLFSFL